MIPGHNGNMVTLVGLFGSESIGKTSTAYMLAGRMRTHGCLAEVVTDSSAAMPFPPDRFDTHQAAWAYVLARKMMRESEFSLRPNVDLIISDRTPLDLLYYARMKFPGSKLVGSFEPLVSEWLNLYDRLYFFPAAGTAFRADGFREPTDTSRQKIDLEFLGNMTWLREKYPTIEIASGSYRERAEFVYHDLLAKHLGLNKPKRVLEQVRSYLETWFTDPLLLFEVRTLGSRSTTRSHIASDTDDFDILVIASTSVAAAQAYSEQLQGVVPYLESVCECSLDIKVVAQGMEPHEV